MPPDKQRLSLLRRCKAIKANGEACRQAPLPDYEYCFWHSPDHEEEAAEARRLGGLRRRREKAVQGAYEFEGLSSIDDVRRLVEIAVMDTLSLESSVARSRTLAYLAQTAFKLFEVHEFDERLETLEGMLLPRVKKR